MLAGTAGLSTAIGFPCISRAAAAKVVVVGGGFGGATAAKYVRRFDNAIEVTLVEPRKEFVTCPFSNTVIGGLNPINAISHHYGGLRKHGVTIIHDTAVSIDPGRKIVKLASGGNLPYDRLIVSPGIDFRWDAIEGYDRSVSETIPHAWKAGPQTLLLRRQLEVMPENGVFAISPPVNPFRCPPGPGERISLVAHYFKTHKPKAKIIVLDPKEKFSKQGLFKEGWQVRYPGMIDYRNLKDDGLVERVDAKAMTLHTVFGAVKADVINFIPPQKAGHIAHRTGLTDNTGWCPVNQRTFESTLHRGIHVVGDASVAAPMPKSGFAASTQAKVCAAAVTALLQGRTPGEPKFVNTCYSLVAPDYGISVAMVYGYADGKIVKIKGSGGLSPTGASAEYRQREADYARGWYESIASDIFG
jgi:sulfide dehydrogenase [flavocytochrome c] flavoprotein subunit